MSPTRIYLVYPPELGPWVEEVSSLIEGDPTWVDWKIVRLPCNAQHGFNPSGVVPRVRSALGPVIILEKVQAPPREKVRELLRSYTPVLVREVHDSTELLEVISDARSKFLIGEPLLPKKFVTALLVLGKLYAENYWAGNAKGYIWRDDIPKGRGIPPDVVDKVHEVVKDLLNIGLLVSKKSCGLPKYALNQQRRQEITTILDESSFRDRNIQRMFTKDKDEVSARLVDQIRHVLGQDLNLG